MEWTNEIVIEFLDLYEQEPIIWNPVNEEHKDRNKVYDAWKRIQSNFSMECSLKELKKKKENLMATYRKLSAKVKKTSKTGSATFQVYKPEWFAYEKMASFLNVIYVPRTTKATETEVQNALDAGSSSVAVRLNLERFSIQVIDNGCGLTREQLDLIGVRYVTSKCSSLEDLKKGIATYGYRGEALASTRDSCAVLMIISKAKDSHETFCKVFRKGEEPKKASEAAHDRVCVGTTVIVKDFLISQPVRRARIRPLLELEEARLYLTAQAIVNHNVAFILRNDVSKTIILQTFPCGNMITAFSSLCKTEANEHLIQIESSNRCFHVSGFISRKTDSSNQFQFLFLNQHILRKTKIHKVINVFLQNSFYLRDIAKEKVKTTKTNLPSSSVNISPINTSKFAVFVINIKCPPNEYDIIFEPKKTLIEFKKWDALLECIKCAIDKFLEMEIDLKVKKSDNNYPCAINKENINENHSSNYNIEDNSNILFGLKVKRAEQDKNTEPVLKSPAISIGENKNSNENILEKTDAENICSTWVSQKVKTYSNDIYDSENPLTKSCRSKITLFKKRGMSEHITTESEMDPTPLKKTCSFISSDLTLVNNNKLITSTRTSLPIVSNDLFKSNLSEIMSNWKNLLNVNAVPKVINLNNSSQIKILRNIKTVKTKTKRGPKKMIENKTFRKEFHFSSNTKSICNIFMSTDKMKKRYQSKSIKRSYLGIDFKKLNNNIVKNISQKAITNKPSKVQNTLWKQTYSFMKSKPDDNYNGKSNLNDFKFKFPTQLGCSVISTINKKHKKACTSNFNNEYSTIEPNYNNNVFKTINSDYHEMQTQVIQNESRVFTHNIKSGKPVISTKLVCPKNIFFHPDLIRNNYTLIDHDKQSKFCDTVSMNEFNSNTNSYYVENNKSLKTIYNSEITNRNEEICLKENSNNDHLISIPTNGSNIDEISTLNKINIPDGIKKEEFIFKEPSNLAIHKKFVCDNMSENNLKSQDVFNDNLNVKINFECEKYSSSVNDKTHNKIIVVDLESGTISTDSTKNFINNDPKSESKNDLANHKNFCCCNINKDDILKNSVIELNHNYLDSVKTIQKSNTDSHSIIFINGLNKCDNLEDEKKHPHSEKKECSKVTLDLENDALITSSVENELTSTACNTKLELSNDSENTTATVLFKEENNKGMNDEMVICNLHKSEIVSSKYIQLDEINYTQNNINTSNEDIIEVTNQDYLDPNKQYSKFKDFGTTDMHEVNGNRNLFSTQSEKVNNFLSQSLENSPKDISSLYWNKGTTLDGKKIYIHSITGMSSYLSPVNAVNGLEDYTMSNRHRFVPKGYSPALQVLDKYCQGVEQLTSPAKNALLSITKIDTVANLTSVKWRNGLVDNTEGKNDIVSELLSEGNVKKENWKYNINEKLKKPYVFSPHSLAAAIVLRQADSKFIPAILNDGSTSNLLVLFDQHAVDERIRLEKLTSGYKNKNGELNTTSINPSLQIAVTDTELVLVRSFSLQIQKLGINLSTEGPDLIITSVPTCLYNYVVKEGNDKIKTLLKDKVELLIKEQIECLTKTRGVALSIPDTLHSIICYEACRGAIKFGDKLPEAMPQSLISELAKCELPFQCAHGRPVLTVLTELMPIETVRWKPNLTKLIFRSR